MKNQLSLTQGKIAPALLRFAVPFLCANLLQALYGAADLLIVGRFCNAAGVSAVSTGSQIMLLITGIIVGLTTGGTVVIGQYTGAKREKDSAYAVGAIIVLFGIVAVGLSIIMASAASPLAALMKAPKEALSQTVEYIFICSCGILFITGFNAVSGILRGMGDSKTPLLSVAIACVINIAGDLLLVGVFHWGVAGAAIATIASQGISFLVTLLILKRRRLPFAFSKENIALHKEKTLRILKIGAPMALQDALVNVSFLIILAIVNTMGLAASAALGVVEKILGFAMLPPSAFSAAIAAMVAQNLGAGEHGRARRCIWPGIGFSMIFGVLFFVSAQIAPEFFISLFSKEAGVVAAGALYYRSFSIDCMLVCIVFCMNGYFSGCGKTLFNMIHGLSATFLVRIPVSYFVSRMDNATMYQMGFAAPAASVLSIIMCLAYYFICVRKRTGEL